MAAAYVDAVRGAQVNGPYFLGGMCAGGTIAMEMARLLEEAGEEVGQVFIFDAAAPAARPIRGVVARRRWQAFGALFGAREGANAVPLGSTMAMAVRKVARLLSYETRTRAKRISDSMLFLLLGVMLERGIGWPTLLPAWNVRRIYDLAEARHTPGSLSRTPVLLLRATGGAEGDEAFQYLFEGFDLGWGLHVRGRLKVVDVPGGHSSMLQDPHVDSLAAEVGPLLTIPVESRSR
jgi:thioesterase domain-containing protein